jgi:hypothetical protein
LACVSTSSFRATVRDEASTWVRAVPKTTPKVSSFAPLALTETAARKLSVFPDQLFTWGR